MHGCALDLHYGWNNVNTNVHLQYGGVAKSTNIICAYVYNILITLYITQQTYLLLAHNFRFWLPHTLNFLNYRLMIVWINTCSQMLACIYKPSSDYWHFDAL